MEKLRNKLFESLNEALQGGLPMEAAYYVVKDVFRDFQDAYIEAINKESKTENNEDTIEEKE